MEVGTIEVPLIEAPQSMDEVVAVQFTDFMKAISEGRWNTWGGRQPMSMSCKDMPSNRSQVCPEAVVAIEKAARAFGAGRLHYIQKGEELLLAC